MCLAEGVALGISVGFFARFLFASAARYANLPTRHMRQIGYLKSEANAKSFGDYLTSIDVRNMVEPDTDGAWAIWVHDEEQIPTGQAALAQFEQNPADPKYRVARQRAAAMAEKEKAELKAHQKRIVTADALFSKMNMGPLTIVLIGISVLVTLTGYFTQIWPDEYSWLQISKYPQALLLPEVREGQVWRLITPIFLHLGPLHILFNMMMMRDLGTLLEVRIGTAKFGFMVAALALVSNLGEYFLAGPAFGGMSGVLYGLFGYIWIRGRVDPNAGFYLPGSWVAYMIAWYFLCLVGLIGGVANGTHTFGLLAGMAWGALPLLNPNRNR